MPYKVAPVPFLAARAGLGMATSICALHRVQQTSLHWGLNPGPSVYKTDALPLSYRGCNKKTTFSTIHHFTIFVYESTLMWNCIGLVPMTNHSRHCLFVVKACCATLWLAKCAQLQRPHW